MEVLNTKLRILAQNWECEEEGNGIKKYIQNVVGKTGDGSI